MCFSCSRGRVSASGAREDAPSRLPLPGERGSHGQERATPAKDAKLPRKCRRTDQPYPAWPAAANLPQLHDGEWLRTPESDVKSELDQNSTRTRPCPGRYGSPSPRRHYTSTAIFFEKRHIFRPPRDRSSTSRSRVGLPVPGTTPKTDAQNTSARRTMTSGTSGPPILEIWPACAGYCSWHSAAWVADVEN